MGSRIYFSIFFIVILALLPLQVYSQEEFVAQGELKKRVTFWIKVYTELSASQGVIHDAKYPEIVFEKISAGSEREIEKIRKFYQKLLMSIYQKKQNIDLLNAAEKRVFNLYRNVGEPNKFYNAAQGKRVRFQLGQKERFLQGLYDSGRYLAYMEKIFKEHDLPIVITRLPFVESSFNVRARSKVGASGIWQFIRSTGKLYLKINNTVDERNDPIRSTQAAAELLRYNYFSLGNWPLAITAYNYGTIGLMRAVREIGSEDLDRLIASYRSRSFGFASSNFFCEFLAAVEVEKHAEKYFGQIKRRELMEYSEFVLEHYVRASDLAAHTGVSLETLKDFNPALTDAVFKGRRLIPKGFHLRIPVQVSGQFLIKYKEIPKNKKFNSPRGLS